MMPLAGYLSAHCTLGPCAQTRGYAGIDSAPLVIGLVVYVLVMIVIGRVFDRG